MWITGNIIWGLCIVPSGILFNNSGRNREPRAGPTMTQDETGGLAKVIDLDRTPMAEPSSRDLAINSKGDFIRDLKRDFIRDLKRLRRLRSFLLEEGINIKNPEDNGTLPFFHLAGSEPTKEWEVVDLHTQRLFRLLNDRLRRKFILSEIPAWVSYASIVFVVIALLALIGAVLFPSTPARTSIGQRTLPFYLIWLISLGATGSVAFIGMNALSVQEDITFNLGIKLILLRIVLGALFGLVLTLPFGFQSFSQFCSGIFAAKAVKAPQASFNVSLSKQALLLLLPFVLGFSTSLVIMILNRLVNAVQAFFGGSGANERQSLHDEDLGVY